jgi:two-component system chemotaxis response regulator CheB
MPNGRVIAIGLSAGGLDALRTLVAGLPADFATPLCVVQHIGATAPGILHQILGRAGNLPAFKATSGMPLQAPGIYVAPPDHHLLVSRGVLQTTKGPKENRFRPAIDPLFRSVAYSHGRDAIGIVLSGDLDDGTSGLRDIKEQGGIAIVQDPIDALHPSMPRSAIRHVAVDHVVPVGEMPSLLASLTSHASAGGAAAPSPRLETEMRIAYGDDAQQAGVLKLGQPSIYTCPDCHGVLLEIRDGGVPRFRCHTGHAYSIESLTAMLAEKVEEAMWSAIRALYESGVLLAEMARHLTEHAGDPRAALLHGQAAEARRRADAIKGLLA